jgi:hypothetical protein
MAISPSRLSSSTEPISRRYMRTGSSVRSSFSVSLAATATSRLDDVSTTSVDALLLAVVLGFLVLDDVDAHFRQHRHHVLDLFGADLIGRQDRVELVVGDVARARPRRSSS